MLALGKSKPQLFLGIYIKTFSKFYSEVDSSLYSPGWPQTRDSPASTSHVHPPPPVPQTGFCDVGSGELNSRFLACKTGTLPTEPSAQPSSDFIFEITGPLVILHLDIFCKSFDQCFLFLLHVLVRPPRVVIGENR